MITSKPFRISSLVIGILLLLFTLYLGYGAYTTKEYSKFFIVLIMFSISLTFIHLGTRGKEEAWKLGRKLIAIGIGLAVVAVLLNYTSSSNINIKDEMTNAMVDITANAAAQDVKKQLAEQEFNLPQDKNALNNNCKILTEPADESSFTMNDICDELNRPESKNLSVNQIFEKALERKTRTLAEEQVKQEINKNNTFNENFDSLTKIKNYVTIFGIIGAVLFILGFVFMYYSRTEDKGIKDIIYYGSISSLVACIINAAIFKILDFGIKELLMQGKIVDIKIVQQMIPGLATNGMQQEMTKSLLMELGKIIYNWLGVALNKAFMFSITLGGIFLILTAIFYLITKKSEEKPKTA